MEWSIKCWDKKPTNIEFSTPVCGLWGEGCTPALSPVPLFVTPWTVACQIPLSVGLPKPDHWSRLPFPPPGIKPTSPALIGRRILYCSVTWESRRSDRLLNTNWGNLLPVNLATNYKQCEKKFFREKENKSEIQRKNKWRWKENFYNTHACI